jgi:hypothetical protein
MNVEKILEEAFLKEVTRLQLTLTSDELANIRKTFDIEAVQQAIDNEIKQIKRHYKKISKKYYDQNIFQQQRMENIIRKKITKLERYHRQNLKKLAQKYAQILAETRIAYLTESEASNARLILKASFKTPCDIYPC